MDRLHYNLFVYDCSLVYSVAILLIYKIFVISFSCQSNMLFVMCVSRWIFCRDFEVIINISLLLSYYVLTNIFIYHVKSVYKKFQKNVYLKKHIKGAIGGYLEGRLAMSNAPANSVYRMKQVFYFTFTSFSN